VFALSNSRFPIPATNDTWVKIGNREWEAPNPSPGLSLGSTQTNAQSGFCRSAFRRDAFRHGYQEHRA
jgi:hypothetical protein